MPIQIDNGYDVRIGSWEITQDPGTMDYLVYIDSRFICKTEGMFEAYDIITDAILA